MRKAVAIPYIIAIVLGIIVIALLGYFFISSAGKGNGAASSADCIAKQSQFCAFQTEDNWNAINTKCGGTFTSCYDFCSKFIPGWKPSDTNKHSECIPTPTAAKP